MEDSTLEELEIEAEKKRKLGESDDDDLSNKKMKVWFQFISAFKAN